MSFFWICSIGLNPREVEIKVPATKQLPFPPPPPPDDLGEEAALFLVPPESLFFTDPRFTWTPPAPLPPCSALVLTA